MPRRRPRSTPGERSLRARIAVNERWSRLSSEDRREATEKARAGLEERLRREVDPDGVLPEEELRERLAAHRRAFYAKVALARYRRRRRPPSTRSTPP